MSGRVQECYEKLSALIDKQDDMTEWEYQFIDEMAEYEERGRLFTAAQMDKIEEIHHDYCE